MSSQLFGEAEGICTAGEGWEVTMFIVGSARYFVLKISDKKNGDKYIIMS
jgi:hypothetical protein